jgi:ABC-type uncharacterized transport system substrate-binding protein
VIFDQAAALRIPAIYQFPESAEQGGFIGYGPSIEQIYRRMAVIVAGLFRGERPHELPVQQPPTFELIINLKTGNALGLTIPENASYPRRQGDRVTPSMSGDCTLRPIAAQQYSGRYWSKSGHREALALSGVGR